ncbi:PepSY domain-containing protein [Tissierella sp. Yu-01]|uniref:PepSY domain-containing protein n=1 Tax=Tissierella sp. Yu-01 TaxID=3035694 RepID=UPI00240D33FD|nr:PepSY domain-containing protein [Tissierella sp. Yu-01]WFA08163.1 PepSY domain-containing protein [Tissierella sp. Yu-01]
MKNQNLKRVVSLVAGSLVVALVVSIMPGSYLVNAEEVSKREAKKIALTELGELKYIDDDTKVSVVIDESNLDKEEPYYILYIRTDEFEYKMKLDAKDLKGNVLEIIEKDLETDKEVIVKDEKEEDKDDKKDDTNTKDHAFYEFKDDIDYDHDDKDEFELDKDLYEGKKPTDEASLNQLIKEGKKAAIADFKETKDKEEFKEAKEILKEIKKAEKAKIKEDTNDDADDKEEDKDIVDKELKTEKQVLLIALNKIGVKVTSDQVKELNDLNREKEYEDLFKLDDLEIELDDDDNPSSYEIEFRYGNYEYEIKINAVTGAILDYERNRIDAEEDYDDDKDDKDVEYDEDNKNNGNNKRNNSKNKSKGNKKNNK